jgi:hypothetical protein
MHMARGNFGNSEEHAKAGSMSSGNTGNSKQHADAGRKGGKAAHPKGRGLQNASEETKKRVAKAGGKA